MITQATPTRFKIVTDLLDAMDSGDVNKVQNLIDTYGHPPTDPEEYYEEVARTILMVLVSLQARYPNEERDAFRRRITTRVTNSTLREMFDND